MLLSPGSTISFKVLIFLHYLLGSLHQTCRQWRPQKNCTPCLSWPKEPSLFSPAVATHLHDWWHSHHNPTLPSLASPTSHVGCVGNACCPGSVAKFRGDHKSVQRRTCGKYGNRIYWASSQHLWAQSQKTDKHHQPPTLSSFCKCFWTAIFAETHPCHSHRRLCPWCHPIGEKHRTASVLSAPAGSKHHLILWAANVRERKVLRWEKNIIIVRMKLCWTTNNSWKGKQYVTMKQVILTCHYWVKNLCPLLSTNWTAKGDQVATCRVDGRNGRIGGKMV